MITIQNQQVRINGRKILLADTPEARLKYLDYRELDLLAELGVNSISATVMGGDVTDITPFIGNNPANGYDSVKLATWWEYINYANVKGIVPFLILSEKENHFKLTVQQERDLIQVLFSYFNDLSIIWTKEEYPTGNNPRLREVYATLKSEIERWECNHLIALHNNTDEVNWTGNNDLIDLIQLQTKLATGNASIKKAYDAVFAVFQSELVGGNNTGNVKQWANLESGMSSGAGLFFPADDLKAPQYVNNRLKYEPEYKILVDTLGSVPTPTKNKVILTYNQDRVNVITE